MTPTTQSRENCPRCRGGRETFFYLGGQYLYDIDRARTQGYGFARVQRLAIEHLLGVRG